MIIAFVNLHLAFLTPMKTRFLSGIVLLSFAVLGFFYICNETKTETYSGIIIQTNKYKYLKQFITSGQRKNANIIVLTKKLVHEHRF